MYENYFTILTKKIDGCGNSPQTLLVNFNKLGLLLFIYFV